MIRCDRSVVVLAYQRLAGVCPFEPYQFALEVTASVALTGCVRRCKVGCCRLNGGDCCVQPRQHEARLPVSTVQPGWGFERLEGLKSVFKISG